MTVLLRSLLVVLVLALATGVGTASMRVPGDELSCAGAGVCANGPPDTCMTLDTVGCQACPQASVHHTPVFTLTVPARATVHVPPPLPALRAAWTDPHYRPPALRA